MKHLFKRLSASVAALAIIINTAAFAADITPEEKAESFLLLTRTGSPYSTDIVSNLQNNMNRYSPLAMGSGSDSGRDAYYFTNNTASTIQVTWEPKTFLHRVMAHKSYTPFNTLVKDFENNVLRLSVAAGPRFMYITDDDSERKNIKVGLSYSRSGGTFATDAKFVQLADYVDLAEMQANTYKYYDVEIPVKDFLASEDFYAFNGSTSQILDPENINGVTIAMDVHGDISSAKLMYFTDLYLAYVPATPTDVYADPTSDSAKLSWSYENTDGITFNIFRDGEYIATTTELSYTDTGLQPETEYLYQVQAVNGATASKGAECGVITNEFFSDPSLTEAGFESVKINGSYDLKYERAGSSNIIEGRLVSDSYHDGAVVVAAAYQSGVMTDVDIDVLGEVTSSGTEFSLETGASDTVKFFAVDSLDRLKLISQVGVLTSDAFYEKRIPKEETAVSDFDVSFVSDVSAFDISCSVRDAFVALAVTDGTTVSDITAENAAQKIAGIDICEPGEDKVRLIPDPNKFTDGYYEFDISEASSAKQSYYASQSTINGVYEDLNDPNVSTSRVKECIESPILNLDLADYKRVNSNKVIELFMTIKPDKIESVADIKSAFEEAVGTVLFCSAVSKSDADLIKYCDYIGIDTDTVTDVTDKLSEADNTYLYKILAEKSCDISKSEAVALLKNSLICAKASSKENTWAMLKEIVSGVVDESLITSDIDAADVYKAMLKTDYKTTDAIISKFKSVISSLKNSANNSGSYSSGGGGGGGGTSSGSTGTMYTSSGAGIVQAPSATVSPSSSPAAQTTQKPESKELFTDLKESHWAYDGVYTLLDENIVSEDSRFRPDDYVTREEFVKMLVMIFKPVADKDIDFTDVKESDWFYPYVRAAYSAGIVSGISDTEFGAGMNITRQDMAKMLYNAIDSMSAIREVEQEEMSFKDADDIAEYAKDAMAYLNTVGIMTGDDNDYANPANNATRAECAVMLSRYLDSTSSRSYPEYGISSDGSAAGSTGYIYEPENYKAARELLTALKITESDDKNYNNQVTRGEFCDMVARLVDLTFFEPSEYYYNDVPRTHDYATAIYGLSEFNIVSGNDAGDFLPDEPITANQAAAITVRALGYTEMMLSSQKFPEAYVTKAHDLKLFKNISTKGETALTRGDVYIFMKNTLDAPVPEISGIGKKISFTTDKNNTAAWAFHNVIKARGICNANYISTLTGSKGSNMAKGRVRIDGNLYLVDDPAYNYYLGYNLEYYYEDESKAILFMEPYENTVLEIDYDDVLSFSTGSIRYELKNRNKTANISDNADMVYNGAAYPGYDPADFTTDRFENGHGRIILVDNDDDDRYDCICIEEYVTYIVNYAVEEDHMLYFRNHIESDSARSISFKDADTVEVTRPNGFEIPFTSMLTNEAASVFSTHDGKYVRIICSTDKLYGSVVTNNVDTVVVNSEDGTTSEYDLDVRDADTLKTLAPGYKGAMILNYKGEISGVVDHLNEGQNYGFIMKAYMDESAEDKVFFKVLCDDGNIRRFTADNRTQIDGIRYNNPEDMYAKFTKLDKATGETYTLRQIIHYTENTDSEDNIRLAKMDTAELGASEDPESSIWVKSYSSTQYRPSQMYIARTVQLDINNLVCFIVPKVAVGNDSDINSASDREYSVRYNIHGWWNEESINMDAVITDRDGMTSTCAAVYYSYYPEKPIGGNKLYYNMAPTLGMVDEVKYKVNDEGETVPVISLINDAAIVDKECAWTECAQKAKYDAEGNVVSGERAELSRGDVIKFFSDDSGIVQYTEILYDASRTDNARFVKGAYKNPGETVCVPYSKSGKGIRLTTTVLPDAPAYDRTDPLATMDMSDDELFMTIWPESNLKILVCDSKNKTVRKGNIYDVKDYKNNPNDTSVLYIRESYTVPSTVCIFN